MNSVEWIMIHRFRAYSCCYKSSVGAKDAMEVGGGACQRACATYADLSSCNLRKNYLTQFKLYID